MMVSKSITRRKISDDEMRAAASNTDYQNVIWKVLGKYTKQIPKEDLDNCGLYALWRALQYHDPKYGQKFTTSLYRFTQWECRRELKRQKNEKRDNPSLDTLGDIPSTSKSDSSAHKQKMFHLRDCMGLMSEEQRSLLNEYHIDKWTMDEMASIHSCSKEAIRTKLRVAEARLRELCEEADKPVYSDKE